jgi:hypothetical protein
VEGGGACGRPKGVEWVQCVCVCGRRGEGVGEWGMRGPGAGRLGRRCDCDISESAWCEIRASWADAAASEADVGIRAGGLAWWCRWADGSGDGGPWGRRAEGKRVYGGLVCNGGAQVRFDRASMQCHRTRGGVTRWAGRGSALVVWCSGGPGGAEGVGVWLHRMHLARCRLALDAAGGWTRSGRAPWVRHDDGDGDDTTGHGICSVGARMAR